MMSAKVEPHGSWQKAEPPQQTRAQCRESNKAEETKTGGAQRVESHQPWPRPTRKQEGPGAVRVYTKRATGGLCSKRHRA